MRIGIVTNSFPVNRGDWQAAFARDFAHELQDRGNQVFVFTPDRNSAKKTSEQPLIHWFPWLGGAKPLFKLNFLNPADCMKIASLMYNGRRHSIQFAAQHSIERHLALWAAPSGVFAYLAKKKLGIPYDVWCLGSDIWVYSKYPVIRSILKKVLDEADTIFADGLQLCEDVEKLVDRKCVFLPTSRILPTVGRSVMVTDPEKKNFLFVGRLEKVKGVDILLEAMQRLLTEDRLRDIRLYIFGEGSLVQYVNDTIGKYHLGNSVFFKGYATAENVALYLSQCQWLVIPSRNESIPVVFSDAMQMQTPVIASDVGDMGYLIRKFTIGYAVTPGSAQELSKALSDAIADAAYLTYKNNTKNCGKMFSIPNTVRRYLEDVRVSDTQQNMN